jgi:TRAP-type C4-dicarboxylate transport system permease small subunit
MNNAQFFKGISNSIARAENLILASVLLIMIVMAVVQILLRNLFNTSLFWVDPFNRLLVLWLAILGAMVATREREHIAIDIANHYLPPSVRKLIATITDLFAAAVCSVMAYHSGRFVYYEFIDGMTTFAELPVWPFELIMPLGMGIMAIRFLLGLGRATNEATA